MTSQDPASGWTLHPEPESLSPTLASEYCDKTLARKQNPQRRGYCRAIKWFEVFLLGFMFLVKPHQQPVMPRSWPAPTGDKSEQEKIFARQRRAQRGLLKALEQ
jgi:hypothetical protein